MDDETRESEGQPPHKRIKLTFQGDVVVDMKWCPYCETYIKHHGYASAVSTTDD